MVTGEPDVTLLKLAVEDREGEEGEEEEEAEAA